MTDRIDEIRAREQAASEPLTTHARMDAYYYSFDRTGVSAIDAVLSAVAVAGKGSHHTDSWGDGDTYGYYENRPGLDPNPPDENGNSSAIGLIQRTAQQSAETVARLLADNRNLLAAVDAVLEHVTKERDEILGQYDIRGGIPADYRGYANACGDVIDTIQNALGENGE